MELKRLEDSKTLGGNMFNYSVFFLNKDRQERLEEEKE
jgi:hypothetical protein